MYEQDEPLSSVTAFVNLFGEERMLLPHQCVQNPELINYAKTVKKKKYNKLIRPTNKGMRIKWRGRVLQWSIEKCKHSDEVLKQNKLAGEQG